MVKRLKFLKKAWNAYNRALEARPYTTQAVTAATFFMSGDLLSQWLEHRFSEDEEERSRPMRIDWARMGRMAAYGVFFGPVSHVWYKWLDKASFIQKLSAAADAALAANKAAAKAAGASKLQKILSRLSWSVLKPVLIKVSLDESIFGPFEIITMFLIVSLTEGKSVEYVYNKVKAQFWDVYKIDLLIWPGAQTINFLFVPGKYRLLYIGMINVLWNAFLSYFQNLNPEAEHHHAAPAHAHALAPVQAVPLQ